MNIYPESTNIIRCESVADVRQIIECGNPWNVVCFVPQEFNSFECQCEIH